MSVGIIEDWMAAYGADVINLAYSYVRNYHQAQDIAQDVFLRAYSRLGTYRGESSVRTWLLAITANRCKDHLRSWSVKHVVHDESLLEHQTAPDNLEHEVAERLERDRLWRLVHELPVKYREVIVLYYQRDLSSAEIAEVLNTSEQTVRTRLHRGRTMLKKLLTEGGTELGGVGR